MAEGPGKYDELCTKVREAAKADVAFLLLLGGNAGHGACLQVDGDVLPQAMAALPAMLREVAQNIEDDLQRKAARHFEDELQQVLKDQIMPKN